MYRHASLASLSGAVGHTAEERLDILENRDRIIRAGIPLFMVRFVHNMLFTTLNFELKIKKYIKWSRDFPIRMFQSRNHFEMCIRNFFRDTAITEILIAIFQL